MIWLRLAQGILCVVEICGLYYLLQVFFEKRWDNIWSNMMWILSGVLLWGLTTYHRDTVVLYSRYYMFLCISLTVVFIEIFCKINLVKGILISVLYFESVYFVDILLGYLAQIILAEDDFIDKIQLSVNCDRLLIMFISRIIIIAIVIFCIRRKNGIQKIFRKYQLIFWGFVILEYLGLFSCERIFYPVIRDDGKTDVIFILFPLFTVLILIIVVVYIMYTEKSNDIKLINNQNTMIEKNYQDMLMLYQNRDKIYHDMKNHLSVLSLLISDKDLDRAEDYISKIVEPIVELEHKKFTDNRIVDIILNDKKEIASNLNIKFDIKADYIEENRIQDIDWCSILANLLDNAIEACSKVDEGKGWIKVNITQNDCLIIVNVLNTYNGEINTLNGKIRSSKINKEIHGLGMESIRSAVEKYSGVLEYHYQKDIFKVNISLFI